MGINLDYFYYNQPEKFQFYRIPKILIRSKHFAGVSLEAKLLYSFMLDRASLSVKKEKYDENGRVYIIYKMGEMQDDLQRGHSSISKYLKELDNSGLIERKSLGQGNPDMIFVKNFTSDAVMEELLEDDKKEGIGKENEEWNSRDPESGSLEVQNVDLKKSEMWKSRDPESGSLEVQNVDLKKSEMWMSRDPINGSLEIQNVDALKKTDLNDTSLNDTSSSLNTEYKDEEEDPDCGSRWREYIKTQVDYKELTDEYPEETELIDKFIDVIINVFTGDDQVRVNSKNKSKNKVVSQLMQLKADHIRNVIQKLKEFDKINSSLSESYILTCLYNSVNVYHVENTGKGKKTGDNPSVINGTKFSNFKEREYDFAELERKFARN